VVERSPAYPKQGTPSGAVGDRQEGGGKKRGDNQKIKEEVPRPSRDQVWPIRLTIKEMKGDRETGRYMIWNTEYIPKVTSEGNQPKDQGHDSSMGTL
jgi:hypothetical protein